MPSLKPKQDDTKAAPGGKKGGNTPESREKSAIFWMAFFTIGLTCLPYYLGFWIAPESTQYVGYSYNIDDHYVYLAWTKQASEGHFFTQNLFTTDRQPVLLFNLLFLFIGTLARIPGLSPWSANEICRVLAAAGLLTLVYHFLKLCIPQNRLARVAAFAFTCIGGGFGWIQWSSWHDKNPPGGGPIDAFQPEAYTFNSIYLFVLFSVGLCLILGTLYAMLRCQQTGKTRYAVIAGICALLAGNIHSYDIFHICAAWGLFMIVYTIGRRGKGVGKLWLQSLLALGMSMPTVLFTYYVYKHNSVFNARAHSDTTSPPIWKYISGYGIEFVLAVAAVVILGLWLKKMRDTQVNDDTPPDGWRDRASALFVVCWAFAGLIVIYIPFMFQRKALMGEHIPLCILAGWGAAMLLRNLQTGKRIAIAGLLVAASAPSSFLYLARDFNHLQTGTSETSQWQYFRPGEWDAIQYIAKNTPIDAPILAQPFQALYIPGVTGHPVWAGHWSETPKYAEKKIAEYNSFAKARPAELYPRDQVDDFRKKFLTETKCQYLLYPIDTSGTNYENFAGSPPPYLTPVYHNKQFVLFKIDLSH